MESQQSNTVGLLRSTLADDFDMRELIEEFIATLPLRTAELDELLNKADLTGLRSAVYQLKGAGGGYGFEIITQFAAEAENVLKEGKHRSIQAAIDKLVSVVRSVEGYDQAREVLYG